MVLLDYNRDIYPVIDTSLIPLKTIPLFRQNVSQLFQLNRLSCVTEVQYSWFFLQHEL